MLSNLLHDRFALQYIFWMGLTLVAVCVLGFLLASNAYTAAMLFGLVVLLMSLPIHGKLSVILSVTTFSSALIMPFFPGRPFLWEFAALLGWSGAILAVAMRTEPEYFWPQVRRHRYFFLAALGYCTTLVAIMMYRGVGFRILGSEQMGGRFYFQQLACAIFPLIFLMTRLNEKTLTRLMIVQCLLTTTYLVSDFVFSYATRNLQMLLVFFELPNDAFNFELQAARFGIRRFQSMFAMGAGLFFFLLIKFNLKDMFSVRGLYLVPIACAIFGIGLLGGHRYLVVLIGAVVLCVSYTQKFFNLRNITISLSLLAVILGGIYAFCDRMPMAAQRAISFLPGVPVSNYVKNDAQGTLMTRRFLREAGYQLFPNYLWIGRGFGKPATADLEASLDPTGLTGHINMGRFYNGFIGLMVNTGLPGTFFMSMFLLAGSMIAWRITRRLRQIGVDDDFTRLCSLLVGLWFANVFTFFFLHGDSEYAMKVFSLQGGLLLTCTQLLNARSEALAEAEAQSEVQVEPDGSPVPA